MEQTSDSRSYPFIREFAWLAGVTSLVGAFGIRFSFVLLWKIWTEDPLQSIGLLFPVLSLIFILREWKQLGWERGGTWWGFPFIVSAFALSLFHDRTLLYFSGEGNAIVSLLPASLPLFLYGTGLVLLWAGPRLCRIAWLPLLLLLLAKPVPTFFSAVFDLPLQHMTAHVARSFAAAIGFAPKTPELLLMFSPDFGMFIAPGCDGIRGASTMGYLALIVGYARRLRTLPWLGYVVGAVMLGYVFNFTRICMLVLYYRLALGHPRWEDFAKQADYLIGLTLFTSAASFFAWIILRARNGRAGEENLPETRQTESVSAALMKCSAVVVGLFVATFAYARESHHGMLGSSTPAFQGERMPGEIGSYRLQRVWYEEDLGLSKAEDGLYESTHSQMQVSLVMWLPHTEHSVHGSWYARGVNPEERSVKQFISAHGTIAFDVGLYRDSNTDTLLLEARCTPFRCMETMQTGGGMHLLFQAPEAHSLEGNGRLLPIAIKIEQPHSDSADNVIYQQMTARAQEFVADLDANEISRRYQ